MSTPEHTSGGRRMRRRLAVVLAVCGLVAVYLGGFQANAWYGSPSCDTGTTISSTDTGSTDTGSTDTGSTDTGSTQPGSTGTGDECSTGSTSDTTASVQQSFGDGGGSLALGTDVTSSDPVGAAITTPVAASISIVEPLAVDGAPAGFEFVGSQFDIEAVDDGGTVQTSATDPFRLVFVVDASLVPSTGVESLEAFRDGALIAPCARADGSADPDPCVADRRIDLSGDARITVLSTHASHWNVGLSALQPFPFRGFLSPVRNGFNRIRSGSDLPLKFSLRGNRGLAVIAAGYPTLAPVSCATGAATGPAVQAHQGTLVYDASSDVYTYDWKSPKSLGGCVDLDLKTSDGVPHDVLLTTR